MFWHQQPLQLQCQPQPTVGTLLLLSWRRCPCHDHVVAVDVKGLCQRRNGFVALIPMTGVLLLPTMMTVA
jgi:hypothetical protein